MTTSNQYRIESLADLFKVPKEKREAMAADLIDWMNTCDEMREQFKPLIDAGLVKIPTTFTWVDDGKKGMVGLNIRVEAPAEQ